MVRQDAHAFFSTVNWEPTVCCPLHEAQRMQDYFNAPLLGASPEAGTACYTREDGRFATLEHTEDSFTWRSVCWIHATLVQCCALVQHCTRQKRGGAEKANCRHNGTRDVWSATCDFLTWDTFTFFTYFCQRLFSFCGKLGGAYTSIFPTPQELMFLECS